jgi:hypothetical protein
MRNGKGEGGSQGTPADGGVLQQSHRSVQGPPNRRYQRVSACLILLILLQSVADIIRYHERAEYHEVWIDRSDNSVKYEGCKHCGVKTHTRSHLKAALEAIQAIIERDSVCYGADHPVVAASQRRYDSLRRKKAQYHSPKPRPA